MSANSDLAYVADALRRRETDVSPWPIQVAWAIYTIVGFTAVDFFPQYCSLWFFGGGMLNGVFCGIIGKRFAKKTGDEDGLRRRRLGAHWGTIFIGIIPLVVLANLKQVDMRVFPQLIILVVGIVYFLAGVHLDRRYFPLSMVLLIGSVVNGAPVHGLWTATGLLVGIGLILLSVIPRKVVQSK